MGKDGSVDQTNIELNTDPLDLGSFSSKPEE